MFGGDPSLSPPPDGNANRTGAAVGMTIAALTFATLFVGLRMYTRVFISKCVGWDDWTIVAALVGTVIGAGLDFPEIHYGFGRHRYYLTDHQYQEFKKYGFGEWIQTFFTLMITKVSICLLLLRIVVSPKLTKPLWGMIAFLVVSNVVLTLLFIFQCTPVDAFWDPVKAKTGKCFSKGQVERIIISQAIISIISDFILALFPIIILRRVHISLKQKVLLCLLMGLGLLTAAACIVRTVDNWQNVSSDGTWVVFDNFMWRTIEVNIGIAAACCPTLPPLFRFIRGKKPQENSDSSFPSQMQKGTGSNASSFFRNPQNIIQRMFGRTNTSSAPTVTVGSTSRAMSRRSSHGRWNFSNRSRRDVDHQYEEDFKGLDTPPLPPPTIGGKYEGTPTTREEADLQSRVLQAQGLGRPEMRNRESHQSESKSNESKEVWGLQEAANQMRVEDRV